MNEHWPGSDIVLTCHWTKSGKLYLGAVHARTNVARNWMSHVMEPVWTVVWLWTIYFTCLYTSGWTIVTLVSVHFYNLGKCWADLADGDQIGCPEEWSEGNKYNPYCKVKLDICRTGCIDPRIFGLRNSQMWVVCFTTLPLYTWGKSFRYLLDRRRVGSKAGVDDMERRKILLLKG
jgi:hypothetical protein